MTKRVGGNIKRWREARGLTQAALAKRVGVSRVFVAYIETHKKTPSLATLDKLAKALKVMVVRLVE